MATPLQELRLQQRPPRKPRNVSCRLFPVRRQTVIGDLSEREAGFGAFLYFSFTTGLPVKLLATLAMTLTAGALAQTPPAATPANPGVITPQFNAARPRTVYPVPYTVPTPESVTQVLVRIRDYLAANSPARFVHRTTGVEIKDLPNPDAVLENGVFNVTAYQWGIVYSGMLAIADATGDASFRDYADQRLKFIAESAPKFHTDTPPQGNGGGPVGTFRAVNHPRTLDDAGAMGAAMIKALRAGVGGDLRPLVDRSISWIHTQQERLADGSFSRSRPLPKSVWLDDLYMSVPALAQMGKLTGETKYYDDAVKQITQFAEKMFNRQKRLWMHGWVESMTVHPEFHWARANGWAAVAMAELLDVLPENHPGRAAVLELYRTQIRGLAEYQGRDGRWHQLLDRPDSYLETSATAMFTFAIARGVNRGWLDPLAHAPMAILAWNGLASQVNATGQVENVCVGTSLGFDPAFYYARPVSSVAPHGPGPVLIAGAEMVILAKSRRALLNDEAMMFGQPTGL